MAEQFGSLPNGQAARLYTITGGGITAAVTDFGATLVRLMVPDRQGVMGDVVLGFSCVRDYLTHGGCLGATVGRNANRTGGAAMTISGRAVRLGANEGRNNLHSGPDYWYHRLWTVESATADTLCFSLVTPDGDQGFPGGGEVRVTYQALGSALRITYQGRFDRDTVFNMTNHAYFNLAGQDKPEAAMDQRLWLRAAHFTPVDGESIPTGQIQPVAGTALDFRQARPLGRGLENDPLLAPQGGIDHNFVLTPGPFAEPAARLSCPATGRVMTVHTDRPGIQVYCANGLDAQGKVYYGRGSGVCLETQFYPDSCNHPQWPQPLVHAGQVAQSVTEFRFSVEPEG